MDQTRFEFTSVLYCSIWLDDILTTIIGIVIGQIYPAVDAPRFTLGNAWTFGVVTLGGILFCIVEWIYKKRNADKERRREAGEVVPKGQWDDRAPDFIYQT